MTSPMMTITRPANTTAYTAGDVIGVSTASGGAILEFTGVGGPGDDVMIVSSRFMWNETSVPSGATSFRLHLYNSRPGSVYADNDAWDLPSGDRTAYLGFVDLGTPVDVGSTLFVQTDVIQHDVGLPSTTNGSLFAYLVTNGGYTPTSGSVMTIILKVVKVNN